MPFFLVAM